jgi:hypothetical protein
LSNTHLVHFETWFKHPEKNIYVTKKLCLKDIKWSKLMYTRIPWVQWVSSEFIFFQNRFSQKKKFFFNTKVPVVHDTSIYLYFAMNKYFNGSVKVPSAIIMSVLIKFHDQINMDKILVYFFSAERNSDVDYGMQFSWQNKPVWKSRSCYRH